MANGAISASLRKIGKRGISSFLFGCGLTTLFARCRGPHAIVLMYHRVLDDREVTDEIHPGMYVTRAVFQTHLDYLLDHYCVVGLDDLRAWALGRQTFAGTPCAITFDDGWEDNYRHAFPLLRERCIPATVFLITDQIGDVGMLTWSQVREMEAARVAFGSHTRTHRILKGMAPEDIRRELTGSREKLRKEVAHPSDWFCYPKGKYDLAAADLVRGVYAAAVTTNRDVVRRGGDLCQVPRIGIHNDVANTISLFACRLTTLL